MAYVITQNCCQDASCVPVCPVDCIRPTNGSLERGGVEMLYIDPQTCIDCGACMEECPVDAIYFEDDLPVELELFREINARYFEDHPLAVESENVGCGHAPVAPGSLRVAIVGSGPAACYAATELAGVGGVEVDMFDRLPTPFGLIRSGVAPDHQRTKGIVNAFRSAFVHPGFECHLNVEVGRDISHEDLVAHHHAVIYAVGASQSRDLGIPGEQLPGHHSAADFIGWYNGHPDHARDEYDLSSARAVIIGNGNVALDAARILLLGPEQLAATDIAEHALEKLAQSNIREVVVLGRRRPADSAFSIGEFLALRHLPGIDVRVESDDVYAEEHHDLETRLKLEIMSQHSDKELEPGGKRIIFRFGVTPVEITGEGRAEALRVAHSAGGTELIEAGLMLRSIGYTGAAIDGLPFDCERGIVPNDDGRVLDGDQIVPGVYVTGWIKRGPRGVIGTNRSCAQQTVDRLWQDFDSGLLNRTVKDRSNLIDFLAERGATRIDWQGWRAIDSAERKRGVDAARPRVKYVELPQLLAAAGVRPPASNPGITEPSPSSRST